VAIEEPVLPHDIAPPLDMTSERRGPNRPKAPPLPPDMRLVLEGMLAHHMLDVRRFISENLESNADRIVSDLRLLLGDQVPPAAGFPPNARPRDLGLWIAAAALVAAFLFGLQWSRQRGASEALAAQLTTTQQQLGEAQQNLLALQAADAAAVAAEPEPGSQTGPGPVEAARGTSLLEPVPFGETPLAGARLERVSGLLTRLGSQGFKGVVQIRSIPGRFCTVTGPRAAPRYCPTKACRIREVRAGGQRTRRQWLGEPAPVGRVCQHALHGATKRRRQDRRADQRRQRR
jgi:hypothetical protein